MIPLLMWATAALPAWADTIDPTRYPWQATVEVPATDGAVRVVIPPDLRQAGEPLDASDLVLLDPDGARVPTALLGPIDQPTPVPARVRPTSNPDIFEIDATERIIDRLDVSLRSGPAAAKVWVEAPTATGWAPVAGPAVVWTYPALGAESGIDLPPTVGPLRVRLQHQGTRPARGVSITAAQVAPTEARPSRLTLPVIDRRLTEDGDVRYAVALPHSLPIAAVTLGVEEPFVERDARLLGFEVGGDWERPFALTWDLSGPTTTLQRVHLGAVALDRLTLPGPDQAIHDTLVVSVDSAGRAPLTIPEVTLDLPGRELMLLRPAAGIYTLLAGAPAGTTPPTDLQAALPEVAALAWVDGAVGEAQPNPTWRPPEDRASLAEPGAALNADGLSWQAPVTGAGLSRVPLSAHVLTHARRDLGDVRLVDGAGDQVPFVLRRLPRDRDQTAAPFTRTEEARSSLLRVPVSTPDLPLSTVTLRTDAPTFARTVTLYRAAGSVLEPLRTVEWVGDDRPVALPLSIDRVVGDELVLRIDNGDDAPLPLQAIDLSWPTWELIAVLPTGGATLLYGDPDRTRPTYDLALLTHTLLPRAKAVASLGEPTKRTPPPRSALDEGMLLLGIAVLVGGLLALTIQLVRGVREDEGAASPQRDEVAPTSGAETPDESADSAPESADSQPPDLRSPTQ